MSGKLNTRFLLITAALAAGLAAGWWVLHRYQRSSKLGEYLAQASRAEEDQKPDRAVRLLRAYVLLAPGDADAKVRCAELLGKQASKRARVDALGLYEQVLQQAPDRHEIRQRAAELAFLLGRVDDAFNHLVVLRKALPGDVKVLLLSGQCYEARERYEEAAQVYEEAAQAYGESRKVDPRPVAFIRLAVINRDRLMLNRPAVADKVIEALLRHPHSIESLLACVEYHLTGDKADRLEEAAERAQEARQLAAEQLVPDRPDVLLLSARVALELAAHDPAKRAALSDQARGFLTRGIETSPTVAELYLLLAKAEARAGRLDEAVRVLRQARKQIPAHPKILFDTAQYCTDAGDIPVADEAIGQLRELNYDPVHVDFLAARCLLKQGKRAEGSGILERIRPLLVDDPDRSLPLQADLLLAGTYGQAGDVESQVRMYTRAITVAPLDPRPRLGLAEALVALGRVGEAAAEYDRVSQMPNAPAGAWLALARLRVYQNLTRPEGERSWDEVTRLLGRAEQAVPDAAEITLLRAEVLVARGDKAGARKLLAAARDKRPAEGEFWHALAALASHDGDPDGALALLEEAGRRHGDSVDLRLARLRITPYGSGPQAAKVLEQLTDGADRFPEDQRVRLLRAVAGAYWLIDNPAEAGRLWEAVARLRPTDVDVRVMLFDAALGADDEAGMQRVLDEIRRLDRDGMYYKYALAARLVWRAGRGDRSGLGEARALLTAVGASHPDWSRVPLGLAAIDEIEGDVSRAIDSYKLALQKGDRQPHVIRRLVQLHYEQRRYAEADEVLRGLEAQAPISGDLTRLAAEVSLRNLDADRALELGRKVVPDGSTDYRERTWLAQLMSAAGRAEEAEKEFGRAIALAPDQAEPVVALVRHHARRKETGKAEAVIRRADGKLAGGDRGVLALAQCYEMIGRRDEAEARYEAAVKASPQDPGVLRGAAQFYQRGGPAGRAEAMLRALLTPAAKAPASDASWARRSLALVLGLRGDDAALGEAFGLLDQNAAGETADDVRTRAVLLATRPARRREAIALLEKAEQLQPPLPDHELFLARLYEADGNWPKARDRMLRLVGLQKDNKRYVAAFADSLIRRGEWSEAEAWIGRLREGDRLGSATVALQVRVWMNRGRVAECIALIREFADAADGDLGDPAARALAAGNLMDGVSLAGAGDRAAAAAAEQFYLRHRDHSKKPEAGLPLAEFYGRHDDPDKALAACNQALKGGAPVERVAAVALAAVGSDAARDDHYRQAETWLTQASAVRPESDDIRFRIAALRDLQRRFADSEAAYRQLLTRNPRHLGTLNNLAILLALTGKTEEAVDLARRAVEAAPSPTESLLDTRGLALTAAGRFDEARQSLDAAAAGGGVASTHYHRAVLYHRQMDKPRAVAALKLAKERGLRRSDLHPLERPVYDDLVAWAEKP
ncbi:MAG: hypothetical protein JWO38_5391 [Gemmataceae bacterium]|nr:hypothetical protein [Gemmataceae bacterium]